MAAIQIDRVTHRLKSIERNPHRQRHVVEKLRQPHLAKPHRLRHQADVARRKGAVFEKREDQQLRDYCHTRAAAQATLERVEIIVEEIAQTIKQRLPRVHHVTLEVEGIATAPGSDKGIEYG